MNGVIERPERAELCRESALTQIIKKLELLWSRITGFTLIHWSAVFNALMLGYFLFSVLEAAFRPVGSPLAAWNFFNIVNRL